MNKSFVLLDKNNNLQKNATVVVKFNCDGKDYLVYCIDENEQNSQIFVSRLVLNSEGNYFIDNILPEEKGKLNNVVYNIVILMPTEAQKGSTYDALATNLMDKFSTKLLSGVPEMAMQEYYSNCSVAITSKVLVENAIKFYNDNLNSNPSDVVLEVPTWTAPAEVTAPTPVSVNNVPEPVTPAVTTVPLQEPVAAANLNVQSAPVMETPVVAPVQSVETVTPNVVNQVSTPAPVTPVSSVESTLPNPQAEKLAVVSDPSLGLGVAQPNVGKNKKAGFANTKYIVIGTVCLVLAITVVITAFVLINNMQ